MQLTKVFFAVALVVASAYAAEPAAADAFEAEAIAVRDENVDAVEPETEEQRRCLRVCWPYIQLVHAKSLILITPNSILRDSVNAGLAAVARAKPKPLSEEKESVHSALLANGSLFSAEIDRPVWKLMTRVACVGAEQSLFGNRFEVAVVIRSFIILLSMLSIEITFRNLNTPALDLQGQFDKSSRPYRNSNLIPNNFALAMSPYALFPLVLHTHGMAHPSVARSPDYQPEPKKRKVRKGTQSCWECKRRKVRCTFVAPLDAICEGCRRRGTTCVSQELPEEPSGTRRLEDRLGRVEAMLEQLAKETNLHTQPSSASSTTLKKRVPSCTTYTASSSQHGPCQSDLSAILDIPASITWLFENPTTPFSNTRDSDALSPRDILQLPPPGSHPVLIARKLLLLGMFLQGIRPFSHCTRGLSLSYRDSIMSRVALPESENNGYLLMTRVPEVPMDSVLYGMTSQERDQVVQDLGQYVSQYQNIPNNHKHFICDTLGGPTVGHLHGYSDAMWPP
ncbi:predicted protein [Uncinocarpus reesii 1704]|uniref:Zn(2)-C6 fungal-type domain-containing protein n=1 Tax=Uncinocarpus reesii (strain UAMH 1704) TaxID=336963 RepID=C4JP34_UNCRE|nr:uncharacterized protein UREG_03093 [Uncinocarpus reesii 1704]EEP78248.1 predicted protein [Uncinocarpus reesii 1704]